MAVKEISINLTYEKHGANIPLKFMPTSDVSVLSNGTVKELLDRYDIHLDMLLANRNFAFVNNGGGLRLRCVPCCLRDCRIGNVYLSRFFFVIPIQLDVENVLGNDYINHSWFKFEEGNVSISACYNGDVWREFMDTLKIKDEDIVRLDEAIHYCIASYEEIMIIAIRRSILCRKLLCNADMSLNLGLMDYMRG